METLHKIAIADSRNLSTVENESIDLVVTSPPYPMIQMWDDLFSALSDDAGNALRKEEGDEAFEFMHIELDKVWKELYRVTKCGSYICINIGDATRTIGKKFQLFSNHSRIINSFKRIGFDTLPVILWRKQTNAPNKFMGSGMLPAGAYVTLEHEYILVFRKGNKRIFNDKTARQKRMESSFFWEERNSWFSDLWVFKGTPQVLGHKELRSRSAAFPFELAYRLINMYSLQNDSILDPFLGTGTTTYASIACGRNSTGIEIDGNFSEFIFGDLEKLKELANERLYIRIDAHKHFMEQYSIQKGSAIYLNLPHGIPVVTRQETGIVLREVIDIKKEGNLIVKAGYKPLGNLNDGAGCVYNYSKCGELVQPDLFS